MTRAYGIRPAVRPESVACPTCARRAGLPCAKKSRSGDWYDASRRCHPARVSAAIDAKAKRAKGDP
jgi:hypothetical protein